MNNFKEKIYTHCVCVVKSKIDIIQQSINEVTEAGNHETKSTAGDKHETARAMMQLEQEKLGNQWFEAEEQYTSLRKIDVNKKCDFVSMGTLVDTNRGLFFIASAIGKIVVDGKIVFVISGKSPLALKLIGSKQKDTVIFNDVSYIINDIT